MENDTCLKLALEGERLCKTGNIAAGIAFLEAAIQAGTTDLKTLSAIYSQLGNAYFTTGEYVKAMEYHKNDLTLTRSINDRLGEGKASGNLGNTLKMLGQFDEAIICCRRHVDISRELNDKIGEGRALYNLGNVYHAKGKHIGKVSHQDVREFPEEVHDCLQKAVHYYESNLELMTELGDRCSQGRAYGNLGNTHYLLGNFNQAIIYHEKRVAIAKEFGDKAAERRAYSNLANAQIFLGKFETAAENYKRALVLAQELNDRAVEAQACYSLGNTYTLLRDYTTAIDYHLRHMRIAQELIDKIGEARAFWSLSNAYSAIGSHEKALHYASKHLEASKEIDDPSGQATAHMKIADLRKTLGLYFPFATKSDIEQNLKESSSDEKNHMRRNSMENMDLLKLTPDTNTATNNEVNHKMAESWSSSSSNKHEHDVSEEVPPNKKNPLLNPETSEKLENSLDDDNFFDLLSRFQGKRMDDQRCSLSMIENKENQSMLTNRNGSLNSNSTNSGGSSNIGSSSSTSMSTEPISKVKEDLLELIAGMQSKRLDEQRASLPRLPGLNNNNPPPPFLHRFSTDATNIPDDNFFDMLMRCQSTRIEDQRSSFPSEQHSAPTVPDEDFFSLIIRLQSERIEDQRSSIPLKTPTKLNTVGSTKSTSSSNSDIKSSKPKAGFKAGRLRKNKP